MKIKSAFWKVCLVSLVMVGSGFAEILETNRVGDSGNGRLEIKPQFVSLSKSTDGGSDRIYNLLNKVFTNPVVQKTFEIWGISFCMAAVLFPRRLAKGHVRFQRSLGFKSITEEDSARSYRIIGVLALVSLLAYQIYKLV